mgnify:FL=1
MGKTITTYLIDGKANGPQYVFISNRICQMLMIPRVNLSIIREREELKSPAFYILLGNEDDLAPNAYIGETENFCERVKDHDSNKDFWERALVFIAKDNALTKADVQYLEYLAIRVAGKAKRYSLISNEQTPKAPNLPEHQKDSAEEFFEDVKLLASFSGCPIFEVVEPKNRPLFHLKNRGANAKGFYSEAGFTVLKDSILAEGMVPSFMLKEKRKKFIANFTIQSPEGIVLHSDYTFSSPSTAAGIVVGRNCNGWSIWKDDQGKTLDEIHRKQLEQSK